MRYFVAFVVALGLFFMVIVLLLRGSSPSTPKPTPRTLNSYATTNAEAQMLIDGPIVANEDHVAVRITVDRDNVTYEQIKGYEGNVVKMERYENNESAYYAFLSALAHAGFTQGKKDAALKNEAGYCPVSDRYVFSLTQDGRELERYWTTSCGNPKTYLGNQGLTINLFQAQVPNYGDLTSELGI